MSSLTRLSYTVPNSHLYIKDRSRRERDNETLGGSTRKKSQGIVDNVREQSEQLGRRNEDGSRESPPPRERMRK